MFKCMMHVPAAIANIWFQDNKVVDTFKYIDHSSVNDSRIVFLTQMSHLNIPSLLLDHP